MYTTVDASEFWRRSEDYVVLDVRSPGEFQHAHIPGAVNLPLFDDSQRAEVGTIYKNSGREAAVLQGLKFAGQRMADLVAQAQAASKGTGPVLIHCWRGGMRSQSVGWLLKTAGMEPIVLRGGYKAFRRYARGLFDHRWKLQVLSGLTGSGKTRVLHLLAEAGEQVLDLEGLANHRGSAFGGIGQANQPSTEQFENELFARLDALDAERSCWVEDEGNRIGTVVVPNAFHKQLRHSPAVFLDSSLFQRVKNLLVDYGDLPTNELEQSIDKIRKRLGPQHADEAIAFLQAGNIVRAIQIVLSYYDKTYLKAAKAMPRMEMPSISIDDLSDAEIVAKTLEISEGLTKVFR